MIIDISTEEKKQEVLDLFKSFSYKKDIFSYYGICRNTSNGIYINKIAEEIGFNFSYYKEKKKVIKKCLFCGKEILDGDGRKKFCDTSCAAKYNNKGRELSPESREKISIGLKKVYSESEKKKFLQHQKTKTKRIGLKERLYRDGLKEKKCELCGITDWRGKEIAFHLHHINGNPKDNRLENLQIVCPNCHSQTENYCDKNRKNGITINCSNCGKPLSYSNLSGLCRDCYNEKYNKSNKPPKKELLKIFEKLKTYGALSKHFNVSNKTIKKWLMGYDII